MTKEIKDYQDYTITESGHVYSKKWNKPRLLKPQRASQSKKGYFQVRLYNVSGELGKLNYVHRLVWETFKGEIPDGYEIDHIDGDTSNNSLSNLQLLTRRENTRKYRVETQDKFLRDYRLELCRDYEILGSFRLVAEKWKVSLTAVNRVVRNRIHYMDSKTGRYSTKSFDPTIKDKWTI